MILVTGGTGFIGRILVSHLVTLGYPVRLLLNPSRDYPKLPRGVSVEVAISSMNDERNLRASMKDIDTVFHLVGTEWKGIHAEFEEVDIRAARMFSKVAKGMGVERFIYLSHIGADRASAYNLLRAKAIAEAAIRESGVPYTIVRSGIVYGQNDHFTTTLREFVRNTRGPLLIPGGECAAAHQAGVRVHTWTVNEEEDIRNVLLEGADIVITNYPDRALACLRKMKNL